MRPAATHGSELYKISGILAIPYRSNEKNGRNGQSEQHHQKPHGTFSEVYDSACSKDADDIDIYTRGYTRTGAPTILKVHMHDYTNQKKHA